MFDLVAIGDPIIDTHVEIAAGADHCSAQGGVLSLPYGAKIPIVDSFQDLGGNAPNVAVGIARLGRESAVVATIGDDATGLMAVEQLKKRGVDTNYITTDPKAKTRYSIVLNYCAERTILSYSDKKKYQWPTNFPKTRWVYYTGLSEGFETIQDNLLKYLKKNPEVRLAINPGSYVLKYGLKKFMLAVAEADILITNLEEAEMLTGTTLAKAKSTATLARLLVATGAGEVVITDGAKGAWAASSDEVWHLPAYPTKPVAKTGAGDAFSSAYLAARDALHDIPHALMWGAANSSSVIQYPGPHKGLLDQEGLEKIVCHYEKIEPVEV